MCCGCVCGCVRGVWLCPRSKGSYCGLGDKTAIELSEKGNWLLSPFPRARYASSNKRAYFYLHLFVPFPTRLFATIEGF